MEKSRFHADRLRIARAIRSCTQAELAHRVGANASTISRLEAGSMDPTPGLLDALCAELDFTPTFFQRPLADEYTLSNCSFRSVRSAPRRLLDQAAARGTALQEALAAVGSLVYLPPPILPAIVCEGPADIELAAAALRKLLGLSLRAPILNVVQLAEHAGVVVTRVRGAVERVDAFSHYGSPPLIVLPATKHSTTQDRFIVAHELGHLIMHRGRRPSELEMEREAELFAHSLLLPTEVFRDEFGALPCVDWTHIFELKRRWKVSAWDILDRATDLNLVPATTARRLRKQYSWRRWHQGEPYEMAPEQPELLAYALDFAERDTGDTLATIAETLGWGPSVAEELTGLAMPDWDVFSSNVARFEDYRQA